MDAPTARPPWPAFSLLYFANAPAEAEIGKFDLFRQSSRFADEQGFQAVWIPERHDRDAKGRQILDLGARHALVGEMLLPVLELCPTSHGEAQVIEPNTVFVEAIPLYRLRWIGRQANAEEQLPIAHDTT